MSRAALALVLLLMATLLAGATPGWAQEPPQPSASPEFPTRVEFTVGGVRVELLHIRSPNTVVHTPSSGVNQLDFLFGLNLTAGGLSHLTFQASATEPGHYLVDVDVEGTGDVFSITRLSNLTDPAARDPTDPKTGAQEAEQEAEQNATPLRPGICVEQGGPALARCELTEAQGNASHAFQVEVAIGAQPGPAELRITVTTRPVTDEGPGEGASRSHTYEFRILDPKPPDAVTVQEGDAELHAWVSGAPGSLSGGACLGTASLVRQANITPGAFGALCFLARTPSDTLHRVNVTVEPPPGVTVVASTWDSPAFNRTSGGLATAIHPFVLHPTGEATLGPAFAQMTYRLERQENGTWVDAGEGSFEAPFTIARGPIVPPGPRGPLQPNWLLQGPILVAAVAGLGYLALQERQRPKFQSRSQAMQAELEERKKPRRGAKVETPEAQAAALQEQVDQQRQSVQEAAWEKKRKILEAKREDVLKSIRIAEERLQRGEITDHVFKGIKERKERQLEQVEKELEELRAE